MCSLPVPIGPVCTGSLLQTLTVETYKHTDISVPAMEDRIAKSQLLRNKANSPSNISSQQNTQRVSIMYYNSGIYWKPLNRLVST